MLGGNGNQTTERTSDANGLIIEQLLRCWDEEVRNAEELAFRENLVLSAIAVLLGVGLYQVQWYREEKPVIASPLWMWTIKALLLAGLVSFIFAFTGLFGKGIRGYGLRISKGLRLAIYRAAQGIFAYGIGPSLHRNGVIVSEGAHFPPSWPDGQKLSWRL